MGGINQKVFIGVATDTGGLLIRMPSGTTVNNVDVFQDSDGVKWKRDIDGLYRAKYAVDPFFSDQTSALQAVLDTSSIREVVFDSGDVSIAGTVNAGGKVLTFVGNGRLVGSGTINNAVLNLRINPSAVTCTKTSCTEYYYTKPLRDNIRVINDSDITVTDDDYVVIETGNSSNRNITLPDATLFNERELIIRASGSSSLTSSVSMKTSGSSGKTLIQSGESVHIKSNGTDWWIIMQSPAY